MSESKHAGLKYRPIQSSCRLIVLICVRAVCAIAVTCAVCAVRMTVG